MKLYFSPGACALASQIVLRELDYNFSLVRVDLKAKLTSTGADFWKINPKGYVPALQLETGEVLTEGAIILQWLSDQKPDKNLLPKLGTQERYRAMEWLNFIASELHKGMGVFFNPTLNDEAKKSLHERLANRLSYVNTHLEKNTWLLGPEFSACDAYLFNILKWSKVTGTDLSKFGAIQGFIERMESRPSVRAAIEAEKG